ncbi:hypothetical protein MCP1_200026 [Candidatus Terasakiella magnetica]|nr:hypothetical protein MCP1_200026 [Candidatus Terasakiella magnetica]
MFQRASQSMTWKRAVAWLMALALLTGAGGDLFAGPAALQMALGLGDDICHSSPDGQSSSGSKEATAHQCCVSCQAAQPAKVTPPPQTVIGRTAAPARIGYRPDQNPAPAGYTARHKRARAPPSA